MSKRDVDSPKAQAFKENKIPQGILGSSVTNLIIIDYLALVLSLTLRTFLSSHFQSRNLESKFLPGAYLWLQYFCGFDRYECPWSLSPANSRLSLCWESLLLFKSFLPQSAVIRHLT